MATEPMILTYKVRHHQDFSIQLRQAKQVAKFAIANRDKLPHEFYSQDKLLELERTLSSF